MCPSWNAIKRVPSRIVRRLAVTHHRLVLKRGRPRPEPKMPGRVPSFRSKAAPRSYSFEFVKDWRFYDRYSPGVPCLVLRDAHRNPRFVLGFSQLRTRLEIRFIQRVYSNEARMIAADLSKESLNYDQWDHVRALETKENAAFAKQLGMHPAEFLVSEFLYRHRDMINNGGRIELLSHAGDQKLYKPIRDRFFRVVDRGGDFDYPSINPRWVLNRRKKRVQDILLVE